ncbi:MAG TPA: hypothetical protein VN665_01785 [Candidatus Paceibacterota bacterium]|nr:hypothetical protein [Candidatus Paceibacterota bacterium]
MEKNDNRDKEVKVATLPPINVTWVVLILFSYLMSLTLAKLF